MGSAEQALEPIESREDKFIDLLYGVADPEEAALQAGYSPSYAESIKSHKLQNPKFIAKVRKRYGQNFVYKLPALHNIYSKAIDEYLSDPQLAIKHPKLLKEMEINAGVKDEEVQPPQVYNIKDIQHFSVIVHQKRLSENQPDIVEGEVIDTPGSAGA